MLSVEVDTDASSSLGFARWLLKPQRLLAVETQESKTKVVPSSSTMVELRIAIEFAMGSSVTPPPTWHLVVGVLPTSPPRYAKVVNCRQRVAEIRNSMAQPTQALNKFGPQIA